MAVVVSGDAMAVGCDKVVFDVTRSDVEALDRYTREELECESSQYSHTPMTMAATMGSTAVLSRLLEKGVKIDGPPPAFNALFHALVSDQPEAAEFLIHRGANVNAVTYDGVSLLRLTVEGGRLASTRQLLAAGATISTKSSPLLSAIYLNRLDLVAVLLDAGAETNFELAGQTPLDRAVSVASEDVVLRLLSAGANPRLRRKSRGLSPLWVATRRGFLNAAREMLSRGARDRQEQCALLLHAAERNDPRLARIALRRFARVDSVDRADPLRPTALAIAATSGSDDVADLLIRHHARVNRADVGRKTPLLRAAGAGQAAMVKVLLAHGADVEAADYLGRTPLIAAAEKGSLAVVRILLEHGAAINAISEGGIFPRPEKRRFESGRGTAYQAARIYRHDDLAAYLLERGADPLLKAVEFERELSKIRAKRLERARALNLAIGRRDIESVRRLATPDIVNAIFMNPHLDQPLCHAGRLGFTEAAAVLLERGAEVNPRFAMMPLVCALEGSHANRKDLAIVRMLLDRGALTDVPFRHLIDASSTVEAMKLMLERGAALPKDVADRLLVNKIRDWGEIEAIQFLLDRGASINARAQSGRPLWVAATQVDPALTKCIIELGADVNSAGDSPISAAVHQDYGPALNPSVLATLDVLFEAGANPDLSASGDWAFAPIHEAATKHVEVLGRLIRAGADLERKDWSGDHPLHFAIRAMRTDNVRALIDACANVNSWNIKGETPLILAAMKGYSEMVGILVAAGADGTRRDSSGKTALDWAQTLPNHRAVERLKAQLGQ